MYDIDMHYPDCTYIGKGYLYLPGEPVHISDYESGCSICGHLLAEEPDYVTGQWTDSNPEVGSHRGIIQTRIVPGVPSAEEYLHLRCWMDTIDQGDAGMTTGTLVAWLCAGPSHYPMDM